MGSGYRTPAVILVLRPMLRIGSSLSIAATCRDVANGLIVRSPQANPCTSGSKVAAPVSLFDGPDDEFEFGLRRRFPNRFRRAGTVVDGGRDRHVRLAALGPIERHVAIFVHSILPSPTVFYGIAVEPSQAVNQFGVAAPIDPLLPTNASAISRALCIVEPILLGEACDDDVFRQALLSAAENIGARTGILIGTRPFFPAISDVSFFGKVAPAVLTTIASNTLMWESVFGGSAGSTSAGLPTVNIGPWGRDYHSRLERHDKQYAFSVLPLLLLEFGAQLFAAPGDGALIIGDLQGS